MALIPCRECGQQVSDRAKICPHCGIDFPSGKPLAQARAMRASNGISLVGFLVLLLAMTIAGKLLGGVFIIASGMALFVFLVGLYFLPAFLAIDRDHPNTLSIIIINLFFGWTAVGWIICLVWALLGKRNSAP
ncbi:MAG: superinfection immunity protein [Alphaproteobacteria bacterium]|nr:superinfection immunity protein [Alphaproteobacteria bacterium]